MIAEETKKASVFDSLNILKPKFSCFLRPLVVYYAGPQGQSEKIFEKQQLANSN